jgi:hypothetical protein
VPVFFYTYIYIQTVILVCIFASICTYITDDITSLICHMHISYCILTNMIMISSAASSSGAALLQADGDGADAATAQTAAAGRAGDGAASPVGSWSRGSSKWGAARTRVVGRMQSFGGAGT